MGHVSFRFGKDFLVDLYIVNRRTAAEHSSIISAFMGLKLRKFKLELQVVGV